MNEPIRNDRVPDALRLPPEVEQDVVDTVAGMLTAELDQAEVERIGKDAAANNDVRKLSIEDHQVATLGDKTLLDYDRGTCTGRIGLYEYSDRELAGIAWAILNGLCWRGELRHTPYVKATLDSLHTVATRVPF